MRVDRIDSRLKISAVLTHSSLIAILCDMALGVRGPHVAKALQVDIRERSSSRTVMVTFVVETSLLCHYFLTT